MGYPTYFINSFTVGSTVTGLHLLVTYVSNFDQLFILMINKVSYRGMLYFHIRQWHSPSSLIVTEICNSDYKVMLSLHMYYRWQYWLHWWPPIHTHTISEPNHPNTPSLPVSTKRKEYIHEFQCPNPMYKRPFVTQHGLSLHFHNSKNLFCNPSPQYRTVTEQSLTFELPPKQEPLNETSKKLGTEDGRYLLSMLIGWWLIASPRMNLFPMMVTSWTHRSMIVFLPMIRPLPVLD